jgi:hypothetical protein
LLTFFALGLDFVAFEEGFFFSLDFVSTFFFVSFFLSSLS